LLVAAGVAYLNQVRRAAMSFRLLAQPQRVSLHFAWPGSSHAANGVWAGAEVVLSGTIPAVVTNDGPRGGAVWGFAASLSGERGRWQLTVSVPREPFAVGAHACEAIEISLSLRCPYGELQRAIEVLRGAADSEARRAAMRPGRRWLTREQNGMALRLDYARVGWRGSVRRRNTTVRFPARMLLDSLDGDPESVREALVVAWVRPEVGNRFGRFGLDDNQLSNLREWALLSGDLRLVVVPDGDGFVLGVADGRGGTETGRRVLCDRTEAQLEEIRKVEMGLVGEVGQRREDARAFLTDRGRAGAGGEAAGPEAALPPGDST
jgi:hypothetical protein